MCPPIDPILPLTDVVSDLSVARSEFAGRVTRRSEQDEDPDETRRRRRERQIARAREVMSEGGPPEGSFDSRAYDDHGRSTHLDDAEFARRPHVDQSA